MTIYVVPTILGMLIQIFFSDGQPTLVNQSLPLTDKQAKKSQSSCPGCSGVLYALPVRGQLQTCTCRTAMMFRALLWAHAAIFLETTCASVRLTQVRCCLSLSSPHPVDLTDSDNRSKFLLSVNGKRLIPKQYQNVYCIPFFCMVSIAMS